MLMVENPISNIRYSNFNLFNSSMSLNIENDPIE